jgi:hypothetical protein
VLCIVSKLHCTKKGGCLKKSLASREWFIKKSKEGHTIKVKALCKSEAPGSLFTNSRNRSEQPHTSITSG